MPPTPHIQRTAAAPPESARGGAVRHVIIGTAGHIDHGKTSLVRALTGIDTDRLPEEQARGMTIELGFAHLRVGDVQFGIVDVPGHERFVRTMVAGAQGIDLALLIVAADDSVMPQTVEHVEILNLLGVTTGVAALTKADRVDADTIELVREDVRELLAGSSLKDSAIVPVSSVTGSGLDALREALTSAAARVEHVRAGRPFRMCIDRVFNVAGRGIVVTGSVLRGSVMRGDELEAMPSGARCRVRQLQSHGDEAEALSGGTRAALNLTGIEREAVDRGCELATPGYLRPSRVLDVRVRCLSGRNEGLRSATRVRLCIGTREAAVRLALLGGGTLAPGESTYAQLRCGEPLSAAHGQRFILRDENAARTLGGGVVLRPVGRRRRGEIEQERAALAQLESADPADRLEAHLRDAGFVEPTDLSVCAATGIELETLPSVYADLEARGRRVALEGTTLHVVPSLLTDVEGRLVAWMSRFHKDQPDAPGRAADAVAGWLDRRFAPGLGKVLLARLTRSGRVRTLGRFVCLAEFAPALSRADERVLSAMVAAVEKGGFSPPMLDEIQFGEPVDAKRRGRLATFAVATGQLVQVQDQLYLPPERVSELKETVGRMIRSGGGITVSQLREALGTSRKYGVPYAEHLDRIGFTRRDGEVRRLASEG